MPSCLAALLFEDANQAPQHIACVLAGKGTAVHFPDGLDDDTGLTELVDIAAPARSRVVDRSAAIVVGGLQFQQRPRVASAYGHHRSSIADLSFHNENH